eukprot:jgi/Ulvmu1/4592/UM002_0321.1
MCEWNRLGRDCFCLQHASPDICTVRILFCFKTMSYLKPVRTIRTQVIQTKPALTVPRGGEAEPQARVTYPTGHPDGIVHFIGGAFVGAAPQTSYKYLINSIAKAGYTVIQTPYPFTFAHEELAMDLLKSYMACVQNMKEIGLENAVPKHVPTHGIGHSNGALMHLLIGSLVQAPYTSNVLMSYNNKEVADAIPIPGFVERARPFLQQGRERGVMLSKEDIRERCKQLLGTNSLPAAALGLSGDDVGPLLSQLSSCLEEIELGATNFKPTPQESRSLIASRYSVPNSLMVRFESDNIDETPEMLDLIQREQGRLIKEAALPGTHVTPCLGPDEEVLQKGLSIGNVLGTAGAVLNFRDMTRTCDTINDWLRKF